MIIVRNDKQEWYVATTKKIPEFIQHCTDGQNIEQFVRDSFYFEFNTREQPFGKISEMTPLTQLVTIHCRLSETEPSDE